MDLVTNHPILSVLLTLLASSTGTFLLSRLFMSKKDAADVATSLFNALSGQVTALSARVESLQHTVDDWRTKYFQLLEQHTNLSIRSGEIERENHRLQAELNLLNPKPALYREPSNPAL